MRHSWPSAVLPVLAVCAGLAWTPALAADFSDPDWPCVQRKVPALWLGQMWTGPMPEGAWRDTPEVRALAATIAPRRTPLETVETLVAEFAADQPDDARNEALAQLIAGTVDLLDAERGQLIQGISRYAHSQTQLSSRVEEMQAELVALDRSDNAAMDRVEEIEDTLEWETRIFRDRAQSLTYVCETPVLLEQRAFAIARIVAAQL